MFPLQKLGQDGGPLVYSLLFNERGLVFFQPNFGFNWCALAMITKFLRQWDDLKKGSNLQAIGKWYFPHFGWGIWKEHNNQIFREASFPTKIMLGKILNSLLKKYIFNKGSNPLAGATRCSNNTQKKGRNTNGLFPLWDGTNFFDVVGKGNSRQARNDVVI